MASNLDSEQREDSQLDYVFHVVQNLNEKINLEINPKLDRIIFINEYMIKDIGELEKNIDAISIRNHHQDVALGMIGKLIKYSPWIIAIISGLTLLLTHPSFPFKKWISYEFRQKLGIDDGKF